MVDTAPFASLPDPGRSTPAPARPGPWDILASLPWLIVVYLAIGAGWTGAQLAGLIMILIPVMGFRAVNAPKPA